MEVVVTSGPRFFTNVEEPWHPPSWRLQATNSRSGHFR